MATGDVWGNSWAASWLTYWATAASAMAGGTGGRRKRRKITVSRRLSEEELRELRARVHEKRRSIWERQEPAPKKRWKVSTPPAPVAYVDPAVLEEIEELGPAIEVERVRTAIVGERMQLRNLENRAQTQARLQKIAALKIKQEEEEEEAVAQLLLLAA